MPYTLLYAEYEEDILEAEKGRLQWALAEIFGDEQEVKKMKQQRERRRNA